MTSNRERFDAKVDRRGPDECWPWRGSLNVDGYGSFKINGTKHNAHRAAYFFAHGEMPDRKFDVCHSCDNPSCVNINHLFLGTRLDNVGDMDRKGRRASTKGELHARVKLTESDVLLIRSLRGKVGQRQLARRYGVTKTAIALAQNGVNWGHLKEGLVRQMPTNPRPDGDE